VSCSFQHIVSCSEKAWHICTSKILGELDLEDSNKPFEFKTVRIVISSRRKTRLWVWLPWPVGRRCSTMHLFMVQGQSSSRCDSLLLQSVRMRLEPCHSWDVSLWDHIEYVLPRTF
jgi:hypothetical protein